MSAATFLIKKVYDAIANNTIEEMLYYLNKLPLKDFKADMADQMLFNLLNVCYNYNRYNMVKPIFKAWNVIYPEQPTLIRQDEPDDANDTELEYGNRPSLFSSLFYTLPFASRLGLPTLIIAAKGMSDTYSALRIIHEFTLYIDVNKVEKAMDLLFQVYGDLPEYTLQKALNIADNTESAYIYNYLAAKLSEVSDYAPVPEYMADFRTNKIDNLWMISNSSNFKQPELPSPLATEIEFIIPRDCNVDVQTTLDNLDDKEILEMMTSGLPGYFTDETVDNKKEQIRAFLRVATTQQKLDVFGRTISQEALNSLQDDIRLYRLLGPANPFIDSDPEELKEGGCRMFLCLAFEADDEDDTQINDWFTGSCLMCHSRIRRRFHAVRRPLAGGGWKECFCSWQCVRHRVSQLEELYLADEYDLGSYAISMAMIAFIEQQMLNIGIQDRLAVTEDIQDESGGIDLTRPEVQERLAESQVSIQTLTNLIAKGPTAMQGLPNLLNLAKTDKPVPISAKTNMPKLI